MLVDVSRWPSRLASETSRVRVAGLLRPPRVLFIADPALTTPYPDRETRVRARGVRFTKAPLTPLRRDTPGLTLPLAKATQHASLQVGYKMPFWLTVQEFRWISINPEAGGGKPASRRCASLSASSRGSLPRRIAEKLLSDFPYREEQDIREALAYAANLAQGENFPLGCIGRSHKRSRFPPRSSPKTVGAECRSPPRRTAYTGEAGSSTVTSAVGLSARPGAGRNPSASIGPAPQCPPAEHLQSVTKSKNKLSRIAFQ